MIAKLFGKNILITLILKDDTILKNLTKRGAYLLVLILFSLGPNIVFGQDHFVQYLEGKIYLGNAETPLAQYDVVEIKPNDTIRFTKASDVLVTVLDDGTNIVYKPTRERANNKSESLLTYLARKALLPVRKPTSSRDVFPSMAEFLAENRVIVLDGRIALPSLNYQDTLYLEQDKQYKMMVKDTINEIFKLKIGSDQGRYVPLFILDREDIKPVSDIFTVRLTTELLRDEIRILYTALKQQEISEQELKELLSGYIELNYGYLPAIEIDKLILPVVTD